MENILEFLENNYIWFLVAAAILLLALIGFIVDSKRKQKKMEGNLDTLDKVAPAPTTEMNVTPNVEHTNSEMNTSMPQMETPTQEINTVNSMEFNRPVEEKVETFSFDANPVTNSGNMTFNDIPTPNTSFEMPVTESVTPKEEIIEPFNIGNPVVMNQAQSFEPVQPIQNEQPIQPVEPVQPAQPSFATAEEPIIKIGE